MSRLQQQNYIPELERQSIQQILKLQQMLLLQRLRTATAKIFVSYVISEYQNRMFLRLLVEHNTITRATASSLQATALSLAAQRATPATARAAAHDVEGNMIWQHQLAQLFPLETYMRANLHADTAICNNGSSRVDRRQHQGCHPVVQRRCKHQSQATAIIGYAAGCYLWGESSSICPICAIQGLTSKYPERAVSMSFRATSASPPHRPSSKYTAFGFSINCSRTKKEYIAGYALPEGQLSDTLTDPFIKLMATDVSTALLTSCMDSDILTLT